MVGETLDSNTTKLTPLITSWVHEDEAISILARNGSLDGNGSIVCIGINPLGNYSLSFQLSADTNGE